jgi:hypothetical protein
MKTANWLLSSMVFCTLAPLTTPAATLYVWQDSPNPSAPFSTWASAAHAIPDAVDTVQPGDSVLVTNGVSAGGLAVTNPLALRSVNGPQFCGL